MGKPERIVFDLVEGDHEVNGADGGRGGQEGSPRSEGGALLRDLGSGAVAGIVRVRGWVSRHRAVSLIATGVAAAVVLGAAGLGTVRERERVDLLRTAPGGVESLAGPPTEAWRYEPDGATNLVDLYGFGTGAVTMGGNVVFLEGEQSGVNRARFDAPDERVRWREADLVAVDARSGEESWRVHLGVDPVCTPPEAAGRTRVLDEVVCLVGRTDERSAVAVTAEGEASEPRRLALARVTSPDAVVPAVAGMVVSAWFEGTAPEVDCSDTLMVPDGCTVSGDVPDDRVIVVRAENARTGDRVWREVVPWNGDLSMCFQGSFDGSEPEFDVDALTLSTWDATVLLWGCGASASFRADGTQLPDDAVLSGGTGDLIVEERYDDETGATRTTVRTSDGATLLTTDGWVMESQVTDGTPSDMLVVESGDGRLMRAFHRDGSPAWESEDFVGGMGMIARVGDTGIFNRSALTTVGVDLRTGRQLWEWNGVDEGFGGLEPASMTFTDGISLMLVEGTPPGTVTVDENGAVVPQDRGRVHLTAVDVETGRTRWHVEHEDPTWFAVDGRLLSVASDGTLVGHHG